MDGIRKVTHVDDPHKDAYHSDHLGRGSACVNLLTDCTKQQIQYSSKAHPSLRVPLIGSGLVGTSLRFFETTHNTALYVMH